LNSKQQEELRKLISPLSGKDRKELNRRAAEMRTKTQGDPKNPRARWCVNQWSLHLLEQGASRASGKVGDVLSVAKGRAWVRHEGEDLACELPRELAEVQQSALAPGDRARIEYRIDRWWICEVLPRRTVLTRLDPHIKTRERAIVANVDVVVVVVSVVAPPLHPRLIDRYLAAIHRGGAAAMIVVNKVDLHEDALDLAADLALLDPYREMGVPVYSASTSDGNGIDEIRAALVGRTAVFVGHSGVGKSSLLAAVAPASNAVAGSVSETGKGRHTTTRSELIEMDGLRIVDTPGIREFAVEFRSAAEVAECFEEFAAAGGCKFGNCVHIDEPGCAVRAALATGVVSRARYGSYRRLVSSFESERGDEDDEPPDTSAGFACRHCGFLVPYAGAGSEHRNHCPQCLHSLHLDNTPGDRAAFCECVMEPIAVWVRKNQEWALVHRCRGCGHLSSNRIAADDNELLLLSMAVRPLSKPAFPLERVGQML